MYGQKDGRIVFRNFNRGQATLRSRIDGSEVRARVSRATKENWQGVDASYSSAYTVAPWQVLWGRGEEDPLGLSPKRATAKGGHTRTYARDAARRCPQSGVGGDLPLMAAAL